jgi:adenylate kinase family enzyme
VGRRINVKGTSGTGKTTFSRALAERLGLAYVELDGLFHGPGWSQPTDDVFRSRVRAAMASAPDGWVIDGNYEGSLGETVVDEADTIVWLDLPLRVALRRLVARTSRRIREDVELWNGNRETWRNALWGRDALFVWTVRSHFPRRRRWSRLYGNDPRLVRLHSTAEANRWLERLPRAWPTPGRERDT